MADFVQVMKDWRRMCETIQSGNQEKQHSGWCKGCPVQGVCVIDTEIKVATDKELAMIGERIQSWAEENPEPEYPTWAKWLEEMGIIQIQWNGPVLASMRIGVDDTEYIPIKTKMLEHIPADIAQKLGLKPKEI